MNADINTQMSM